MAGIYEIEIEQGSTYKQAFRYQPGGEPADLSTYDDIRMQIRPNYADKTDTLFAEATLANGKITLSDQTDPETKGYFIITFSATDTVDYQWDRQAFYDIELQKGTNVDRILAGRVTLQREVTR